MTAHNLSLKNHVKSMIPFWKIQSHSLVNTSNGQNHGAFLKQKKFPWRYNNIAILIKPFTHDEMFAAQRYLDFSDSPRHLGLDRPYGLLNEVDNKIGTVFKAVYTTDRENYDWEAIDSREKLEASNASFERMIKWNNEQIAILDKYSKGE